MNLNPHSDEERLRSALSIAFPLYLEPTHLCTHCKDGLGKLFAIYVEPPDAPGINEVLKTLRKKLCSEPRAQRDTVFPRYIRPAGGGIHALGATVSTVESAFDDEAFAVLRSSYRLILTRDVDPIGYCTFSVALSDVHTYSVDIAEIWIERPHRGKGLGTAMAVKTAEIARNTLLELDRRFAHAEVREHELLILVCAEIYSTSGEDFLFSVSRELKTMVRGTRSLVFQIRTESRR